MIHSSAKSLSVYIHIPFCEVKCGYCDFFSVPRGYEDFDLQTEYVRELLIEIEKRSGPYSGTKIHSLFFGGGTPSLLKIDLLEKILKKLAEFFVWDSSTEITLESNPKTVSYEKLKEFRSLGINRLSVGVQSFQDRFLQVMGRIHSGNEARKTMEDARQAGFENLSLDLIYALPGQTFEDWQKDLEEALSLKTPHLSAYHLTIEEGTSFETLYRKGKLNLPAEEIGVRCLEWTRKRLRESDIEAYEISNFSKRGFESIHNQNYWQYGRYLGFGAGASSFIERNNLTQVNWEIATSDFAGLAMTQRTRQTNVRDLKKYLAGEWVGFSENLDRETAMGEFCMLGLRTREGLNPGKFLQEFGESMEEKFGKVFQEVSSKRWMEKKNSDWVLTQQGILFSNEVSLLFLPE